MDLIEAAKFSQERKKEIMIIGDSMKYKMVDGEMLYDRYSNDSWHYKVLTIDMVLAEWQEWQEQREYFTFLEAMTLLNDESNILKYDVPSCFDFEYISENGIPYCRFNGDTVLVKFIPEHFEKKWYIVNPAPEPDKAKKHDWHNCPRCNSPVKGEGPDFVCCQCICKWSEENDPEPVFDLTYEEAYQITRFDGEHGTVQMEGMKPGEFFTDNGVGDWENEKGELLDYYTSREIMVFAGKKYRQIFY